MLRNLGRKFLRWIKPYPRGYCETCKAWVHYREKVGWCCRHAPCPVRREPEQNPRDLFFDNPCTYASDWCWEYIPDPTEVKRMKMYN